MLERRVGLEEVTPPNVEPMNPTADEGVMVTKELFAIGPWT